MKEKLRWVLIGGHAMNVHGVLRQTGDIDLMVSKVEKKAWMGMLQRLKYNRDYNDLLSLLMNKVALSEQELRALCEKYASKDLFEKLSRDMILLKNAGKKS